MGFQPIKRILPQVVASHGITERVETRQILQETSKILHARWGAEKTVYIRPVAFRDGMLIIESSSAAASQELRMQHVSILNELNRVFGRRVVRELQIRFQPSRATRDVQT